MNNHIHNKPLCGEYLFEGLIERALLHQHQQDESIDTVQHRYPCVPDYYRAWIDPDQAGMRCQHGGVTS